MEIHRGDLVGAVGELKDAMAGIQAIRRELAVNGTTNNNNPAVNINAGGVGVWISATCCLICIALIPLCSAWISRELTRKDAEVAELRDKIRAPADVPGSHLCCCTTPKTQGGVMSTDTPIILQPPKKPKKVKQTSKPAKK